MRQDNVLHIMGTTGRLEVDQFWFAGGKQGGTSTIRLLRPDGPCEPIRVVDTNHLYSFEFETANRAIRTQESGFTYPGLDASQSLATARTLDRWRSAAGLDPLAITPPA